MTHTLVRTVRRRLRALADPARAAAMQAYMKSAMPFLGVAATPQHALWRELFGAHQLASSDQWQSADWNSGETPATVKNDTPLSRSPIARSTGSSAPGRPSPCSRK